MKNSYFEMKCEKCKVLVPGMCLNGSYQPAEYLFGQWDAQVLIVGINPRGEIGEQGLWTEEHFRNWDIDHSHARRYFSRFKLLFQGFEGQINKSAGIAYTDLFKCFSKRFPPEGIENKKDIPEIVRSMSDNCLPYFVNQISKMPNLKFILGHGEIVRLNLSWHLAGRDDHPAEFITTLIRPGIQVYCTKFIHQYTSKAEKEAFYLEKQQKIKGYLSTIW